MSRDVYDKLLRLDRGMAAAYKAAVGDRFGGKIDADEALAILARATDNKKITPKEAEALVLLLDEGRFTKGARGALKKAIKKKRAALWRGTRVELTGARLGDVKAALAPNAVKDVCFRNPFGHQFLPTHYAVIWKLIVDDEIDVYELDARGLNTAAGLGGASYRFGENELNVYKAEHGKSWQALVIHEATHAVQDWFDRQDMEVRYVEADAYTAQGIACRTLGVDVGSGGGHPLRSAYHGTSRLVFDPKLRKEKGFEKRFAAAYFELVEAISKYPLYQHKHDDERDYSDDREGQSERTLFRKLHRKLREKP